MNGTPVQPILDSAERAASSGDYTLAESLLREVARLQAASLGSQHPDLASTFNNLGVVCERANKLLDAGQFYRQALSIASASLDAEDPLVVTSRNNFDEFHRALGLVDLSAPQDIDVATSAKENDGPQTAAEPAHHAILTTTPPSSELPRLGIVAGIAIAVALLGSLAIWLMRTPAEQPTADETRIAEERLSHFGNPLVPVTPSVPAQESASSQSPATDTVAEQPEPNMVAERPVPRTIAQPPAPIKAAPAKTVVTTPSNGDVRVVEASLCGTLSTTGGLWECTPTPDPVAGDSLYFYTRIVSPTSIRVHHRWYRNGAVQQDVNLAIQANPSAGYRTYSRQRVDAGDWRVAAVDADGTVLREERIAVR